MKSDLCYALCRFVREVKKLNGKEFPPNTVRADSNYDIDVYALKGGCTGSFRSD